MSAPESRKIIQVTPLVVPGMDNMSTPQPVHPNVPVLVTDATDMPDFESPYDSPYENTTLIRYEDGRRVLRTNPSGHIHSHDYDLSRRPDVAYVIHDCGNMCSYTPILPHVYKDGRIVRLEESDA